MSSSDTIPPEVNITELYITYIDGKGYIQVSGSYEDASELHSLSMSYNMKAENGHWLPGSGGITISELNGDGTFSVLHEISDNIPNGELNINQLIATDINGNRLQFSADDLQAVNDLIPDPTYVKNPGSADDDDPLDQIDPVDPIDQIDPFNQIAIKAEFDPETGELGIFLSGRIENPQDFLSGRFYIQIGNSTHELDVTPNLLDGDMFVVQVDASFLQAALDNVVNENSAGYSSPMPVQVELIGVDFSGVTTDGSIHIPQDASLEIHLALFGELGPDAPYSGNDMILIGRDSDDLFYTEFFSSPGEPSVGVTLAGGDGGDQFIGTIGDDTMYGGPGDDVFQASGGTDIIFGGAGNDLLRTNNIPSQVDVSQGSKLINLSAFKNVSGNIIVGGTVIGPDADEQNISFGFRVRGPDGTDPNIASMTAAGNGEDVVAIFITAPDGTNLIAAMTETSRVLGEEAADGLVAYSFYVFNADGGDVPAGLELDFTFDQQTAVNGAPLLGFAGPLVVPAADDPILEEAGGVMLYSYDGADAVYDNA